MHRARKKKEAAFNAAAGWGEYDEEVYVDPFIIQMREEAKRKQEAEAHLGNICIEFTPPNFEKAVAHVLPLSNG